MGDPTDPPPEMTTFPERRRSRVAFLGIRPSQQPAGIVDHPPIQ